MPYTIQELNKDKVILERAGTGFNAFLFTSTGCIFSGIGILLFIFLKHMGPPYSYFSYLFFLFGLIAVYAGANLSGQTKKTIPKFIIFDNRKGYVQIQFADDSSESGYIPYPEIDSFFIDIKEETRSTGGSRSSGFTTTYTYHPTLQKKDGSKWELSKVNSKSKAEEFINSLKDHLQLNNAAQKLPEPVLTNKVENETSRDKAIVKWRNNPGSAPVFITAFCMLFIFMGYIITSSFLKAGDISFFFCFVAGFIFIVFLIVIYSKFSKIIRDYKTTYGFSISSTDFKYFEEDNKGEIKNTKTIPLKDMQGVYFNFQPSEMSDQITSLYIQTVEKENAPNDKYGIETFKKIFTSTNLPLDLSDLNAVEKLELERWIQDTIKKRSGVSVL
jgi:hypothetical protein